MCTCLQTMKNLMGKAKQLWHTNSISKQSPQEINAQANVIDTIYGSLIGPTKMQLAIFGL